MTTAAPRSPHCRSGAASVSPEAERPHLENDAFGHIVGDVA
jgi:hypothetical protein